MTADCRLSRLTGNRSLIWQLDSPHVKIEPDYVLVSVFEYFQIVEQVADRIAADYQGIALTVVVPLSGAGRFTSDLLPALQRRGVLIESIYAIVASSMAGTQSTGKVEFRLPTEAELGHLVLDNVNLDGVTVGPCDLTGKHVLVPEDMVDKGVTLSALIPALEEGRLVDLLGSEDQESTSRSIPASVNAAALYAKPHSIAFLEQVDSVRPEPLVRYVGKVIPDLFVVGQGMDCDGKFRELRDLWVVRMVDNSDPEIQIVAPPLAVPVPASIADEGASLDL